MICLSNQFAANFVKINQEIKKLYAFEVPFFLLWKPPYLRVDDVIDPNYKCKNDTKQI